MSKTAKANPAWVAANAARREEAATATRPVATFMPEHDFSKDRAYQNLIQGMTKREIEFCKALALNPGCKAKALQLVAPDLNENSASTIASRVDKSDKVAALKSYLTNLYKNYVREQVAPYAGPVTLEEVLASWETAWRNTRDPELNLRLGEKLIHYRGLDGPEKNGPDDNDPFTSTEAYAEFVQAHEEYERKDREQEKELASDGGPRFIDTLFDK